MSTELITKVLNGKGAKAGTISYRALAILLLAFIANDMSKVKQMLQSHETRIAVIEAGYVKR